MTRSSLAAFPRAYPLLAVLPLAIALAGCESSSRFGGGPEQPTQVAQPLAPEPGIAAPTTPVTAQPLPPLGEASPGGAPPGAPAGAPVASAPGSVAPSAPAAVASAAPASAPSARGLAGSWKISDAARGSCAISLTQQSLLDLYRASPAGCQAGSLAKVNAWQQRGQEIVLLEP